MRYGYVVRRLVVEEEKLERKESGTLHVTVVRPVDDNASTVIKYLYQTSPSGRVSINMRIHDVGG